MWWDFIAERSTLVWVQHSLFSHSPGEGHLGYFQVGTVMNRAAMSLSR